MQQFKRFLAFLLCLCLLPCAGLAEGFGTTFHLSFDMNASAYPEDVQKPLFGIADLFNALELEGTFQLKNGQFDAQFDLLVNGSERSRTPVHVFGDKVNWMFQSMLLAEETVYLYMDAFLEFAMKTEAHMGFPAQRAAVLLSPYVHEHGVSEVWAAMKPVLFASQGSRKITSAALQQMAKAAAAAAEERAFRYWAAAMGRESSYEYEIRDLIETLPDWVSSAFGSRGLTVEVTDTAEQWTSGDLLIFERTFSLDDAQSMKLSLPASPSGYVINAEAAFQPDDGMLHGSIDVSITDAWDEIVLDLHASGTIPTALPVTRPFSVTWDADGTAVGGDGVHLYFEGEGTEDTLVIRQLTPEKDQTMITVTLSNLQTFEPTVEKVPLIGTSFFFVTSDTLGELMRTIAPPIVKGILPVLVEVPASACQSIMDLLEDCGAFGLLTEGLLVGSESDEWSDEGWKDEWTDEDEAIW